jgi:tight adherence protein B
MNLLTMIACFAVSIAGCLVAYMHYHQRVTSARRSALFLDRVGQGSDGDELAALDDKPQRYAKARWLQNLLRDMPFVNELAEFIDASGTRLTVAMLLTRMVLCASGAAFVGFFFHRPSFAIFMLALVGGGIPYGMVWQAGLKRAAAFEAQLPQALELISLYLRSGRSLPQAFVGAIEEMQAPASEEFLACAEEYRLGRPLEAALRKLAQRYIKSSGFRLFTISVAVLGQTGGNLVEVLERIKRTLDSNIAYGLKLSSMTSESRMSARILGALPGLFMLAAAVMIPDYFGAFTETSLGRILLAVFFFLWFSGLVWIRNLMSSQLV